VLTLTLIGTDGVEMSDTVESDGFNARNYQSVRWTNEHLIINKQINLPIVEVTALEETTA
jgi:hypothetical protein